jgi:heme-degrading monooxygenase HmoA
MFLFQELLKVTQTRQSELIARQHWIHGLMAPHKGFAGATLARFAGNPTDYLVLRTWDSEEDFTNFRAGPDGNYGKNRPEGLFEGVASGRRYESGILSNGDAQGGFIVRSVYAVPEGRGDEFVENRKRHDGLALQVPGHVYLRTFQCMDTEGDSVGTFLGIVRRTSRDAYNAYLESEQAKAYRAGNVRGLYKTVSTECYEVVDEVGPVR